MGELVAHWWNQRWGTSSRRDIRLEVDEMLWRAEGAARGRTVVRWLYHDELTARGGVQQLIDADDSNGQWADITAAFRASEEAARHRREGTL